MDLRQSTSRPSRPQPAQRVQTPAPAPSVAPVSHHRASEPRRTKKPAILAIVALALVLGGLIVWNLLSAPAVPRSDRYQAVFLDNDQVFFGKLKNTDGEYLRLEQAYSTRSANLPEGASDEQKAATANNVSLVKVGDLVYGPENVMMIRAEKVKFWQDLKSDSKVTKAIESASE